MATSSPDPLALLRNSVATSQPPITSTTPDPTTSADSTPSLATASHLIFTQNDAQHGHAQVAVPLTASTRFVSPAAGSKPVDLRSVYFAWQHRDTGVGDYIAKAQALREELQQTGKEDGVLNLVFAEKLDLVTWLAGEIGETESEYITSADDTRAGQHEADNAAAAAAGGEDVEMRDAGMPDAAARAREAVRLREIYAAERKMGDRNTVLRGAKAQDFGHVRKYSAMFLSKSGGKPGAQGVNNVSNPALRGAPTKPPTSNRRPDPIILLSPSASSLLRMPNIKPFLSDGHYEPPTSGTGANILHLTRTLPSLSPHPLRFILVESPENFRPDYWDRVVAVFTTGQTWQFKDYKWQHPAELFAHALGVYVGWRGEVVPETVKGWGRGVIQVAIDKGPNRWRDREVVEDVWGAIETRMKGKGWGK